MKLDFHVSVKTFFTTAEVQRALKPAMRKYLWKAGGKVRSVARKLIKRMGRSRKPPKKYKKDGKTWTSAYRKWRQELIDRPTSQPGTPPYTHTGALRDAIYYGYDVQSRAMLVGPSRDRISDIGELHEFGGFRHGDRYPARPFMRPAMDVVRPQLPEMWRNSITKR